jgi:aerobic C4-dicarboxylate transport protein
MNIIPNTFVGAFSEGNILQVLFVAVLSGFALVTGKTARGHHRDYRQDDFCDREHCDVDGPLGTFGAIAFTDLPADSRSKISGLFTLAGRRRAPRWG